MGHHIIPRFTYYGARIEYLTKDDAQEEYKDAIFFDSNFNTLSIEDAIRNPIEITISHKELDLIIPLVNQENLEEILTRIREADYKSHKRWIDPVIIIKSEQPLRKIETFVDKNFVSIEREEEAFYSVLSNRDRAIILERYLDKICNEIKIGNLTRSDIVFYPSQVNQEFHNYLLTKMKQLQIF